MSDRVKNIIKRIRSGESVSSIARDEKLNRYSVSLIKQTLELIEKEKQTEQETLYNDEIDKLKDEINKVKDENSKLKDENKKIKEKLTELTEQNKKLLSKLNENESFLKCLTKHIYEFFVVLFAYNIILFVVLLVIKKFLGG